MQNDLNDMNAESGKSESTGKAAARSANGSSGTTDPQKWLDFLDGKLSPEERQQMEEEIAQSAFLKDAMEGLYPAAEQEDLRTVVKEMNQNLQRSLNPRKTRKSRKSNMDQVWIWVTIIVLLGICLLGYYFYAHFTMHQ